MHEVSPSSEKLVPGFTSPIPINTVVLVVEPSHDASSSVIGWLVLVAHLNNQ